MDKHPEHGDRLSDAVHAELEERNHRVKLWLLLVSLATIVFLLVAALQENLFPEWRSYRSRYAKILKEKATDDLGRAIAGAFEIKIDQNVLPDIGVTDRCVTCHAGVDDPRMTDQPEPFTTHPGRYLELHEPGRFGCTSCHRGQGLATTTNGAHGREPFWDYPILEPAYVKTGCATCHDETELYRDQGLLAQADRPGAEREPNNLLLLGRRLATEKGCLGCHAIDGKGGTLGPEISFVGDKSRHQFDFSHLDRDAPHEVTYWLKQHFLRPDEVSPGTLMPETGLSEREADALTVYMFSLRRDAPGARRARRLERPARSGRALYSAFCSACHGEDGRASKTPQITTPILRNPDAMAVASDDYYRRIISSGRSQTKMPPWKTGAGNLSRNEIDRIVGHIRGWEAEGAKTADVDSRLGDPARGRSYYRGLCASCHGPNGEGGIGNSLRSPTFLAVASDRFLAETIIRGRPGTAMPSWKDLPAEAVSDLLAHLRSRQPGPPSYREVRTVMRMRSRSRSLGIGKQLYAANCAACHGRNGEGGIGVRLNSPDLLGIVDDRFLHRAITEGRPTTAMPAWTYFSAEDIAAILVYLRSWQPSPRRTIAAAPSPGNYILGEDYFRVSCARCHGEKAQGGVGPQLANPVLLASVSDAMLLRWIGKGRRDTAMRGFLESQQGVTRLSKEQIVDLIAYIRHLGARSDPTTLRTHVGNPTVGGQIFQGSCASCHGVDGEGASGPQLSNPAFLHAASDGFLISTMILGRVGTPMRSMVHGREGLGQIPPAQIQDVVAYIRQWEDRSTWRLQRAVTELSWRAVTSGREKYSSYCSGCHGPNGLGERDGPGYFAPAINNPEFLDAASDGFLLATIARGRTGTPMRPFGRGSGGIVSLASEEISDIVSYMRSWQEMAAPNGGVIR